MPRSQLSTPPTAKNTRQRGLNTRNVLRNNFERNNSSKSLYRPNLSREFRRSNKNPHNLPMNCKQLEIETVIKGSVADKKLENQTETRFTIPNIQTNMEIQTSMLYRQQGCKEELNHEITAKVPKSPPNCMNGDFASIELLDN